MERLTYRENDIVYIKKDGDLIAPVNMSSFDIRKALELLAMYEDGAEQWDKGCTSCIQHGCWNCRHKNQRCKGNKDYALCGYYESDNYCSKCGRRLV